MTDEWSPWRSHDGSGCPVSAGTIVEIAGEFGKTSIVMSRGHGSAWDWPPDLNPSWWIRRYRVKRPRGMEMLRRIMEGELA